MITDKQDKLEYWLKAYCDYYPDESYFGSPTTVRQDRVSIFDLKSAVWVGINSISYDKMVNGDKPYFMKSSSVEMTSSTYLGTKYVEFIVAPDPYVEKEFESVNINSNISPTKVWFGTTKGVFDCYTETFYKYTGYFCKIPLKSNGRRLQSRYMFVRIEYTGTERFEVVNVITNYKQLKLT